MHPPPSACTLSHVHIHYSRPKVFHPLHPRIQAFFFVSFWCPPAPFSCKFYMTIFSRELWALGREIWSGDLLHVSLRDSRGVNYVPATGQPYLWEACRVFRCWSERCGLKRLLHGKSGHAGQVCLDSVCLHVCLSLKALFSLQDCTTLW